MNARTQAMPRLIRDLDQHGGLSVTDIAETAAVSEVTVSLWKAGTARPQPDAWSLLSCLHDVVERLGGFYEPHEIRAWLHAPHPQSLLSPSPRTRRRRSGTCRPRLSRLA